MGGRTIAEKLGEEVNRGEKVVGVPPTDESVERPAGEERSGGEGRFVALAEGVVAREDPRWEGKRGLLLAWAGRAVEGQCERGGVDPGSNVTPWGGEAEGGPGGGETGQRGIQGFAMTQLDEEEEEELGQTVVGTVAAHAEGRAAETGEEGSSEGHEAVAETSVSERRPARGRGLGGDVELVVSEESGVAGGRGEEERGVVQREREHAVEDGGGADGDERKGFPDGGEGGDGREHLQGKANSAQPLEEVGHLGPRW